jgi:hypothetical protein
MQAHDHPRFRSFAARYGQRIHQLNMRLSVALLRNVEAEMRAKDLAEAPTVKTKEQIEKELREGQKKTGSEVPSSGQPSGSRSSKMKGIWRRQFRSLPENKAVDLFADVVGDGFILTVAGGLIIYEYWRSSQKPDRNLERIEALEKQLDDLRLRNEELTKDDEQQRQKLEFLEKTLKNLKDPKTKKALLPSLQSA